MEEKNVRYGIGGIVDTSKADKSMWLMKCPALVSRSLRNPSSSDEPPPPVAKVILSIDPLHSTDDSSSTQVFLSSLLQRLMHFSCTANLILNFALKFDYYYFYVKLKM